MLSGDDPHPRIHTIGSTLPGSDHREHEPHPAPGDPSQAAVSLVLRAAERHHLELLLIKRARFDGDPWSGHMALPGGRRDPVDPSLRATAERETREETGIELADEGRLLGRLEVVGPMGPRLPRLTVTPFVFGVGGEVEVQAGSPEVEAFFWVSEGRLRDGTTDGTYTYHGDGFRRDFPCFWIEGHAVWGMTYRILSHFLELTRP